MTVTLALYVFIATEELVCRITHNETLTFRIHKLGQETVEVVGLLHNHSTCASVLNPYLSVKN